ncbi:MAG: DUF1684 domain-containing protein [Gammaproteobacteria bacterium]
MNKRLRRTTFMLAIATLLGAVLSACGSGPNDTLSDAAYRQSIRQWRAQRLAGLTRPDGWLSLVGLLWLKPGDNSFGAAASNDLTLDDPRAPGRIGTFTLSHDGVRFTPAPGTPLTEDGKPVAGPLAMVPDTHEHPTELASGSIRFYAIERVGRFGVRVKDSQAPTRVGFKGLDYFPIDRGWRFHARFVAYDPVKKIPIVNVLGMVEDMPSPGALVFEKNGKTFRLDTVDEGGDQLFVMFADKTSGKSTYGAGRFIYVDKPVDGHVVLDFNEAYNPPCAFTSFATCPMPPPGNRLKLAITAGEKRYAGGHGERAPE